MPELIDHYFLVDRRDVDFVLGFLDKYLPARAPTSEDYLITTLDGEVTVDAKDIMIVLSFYEHNVSAVETIYLENLDNNSLITHAILTYTDDAKMVLGISVMGTFNDPYHMRDNLSIFNDIKSYLNAAVACMTLEEPPPDNSVEFIEFAKQREWVGW